MWVLKMKIVGVIGLLVVGLIAASILAAGPLAAQSKRPLNVPVYKKHHYRGGYSVRKSDTIDTRRFVDPTLTQQSQGGPFDNGFFFETPRGPYGGTAPYFQ
jgi:hypothetical protein